MKIIQLISCLMFLAGGLNLKAASGTWTGATDATWAGANWSATPVPGTGDTATFNGAGGGHTTIDLGSGVTIMNLLFNTGSAAAYTIGNGAVGSQTLTLNNNGGVTMNSTVASNQLFNAAIVLGTDGTAQTNTIVNNGTNALTFAGNIYGGSGGTAGTKTLAVGGSGNTVISGNITNGGATTVAITKTGTGNLTINGTVNATTGLNSQGAFGTVAINAGNLVLDFSNSTNADLLDNYSPVSLGGGTLQVIGNSANASTQNFTNGSGVTVNPGFNVIVVGPNGGNLSNPLPTLNLGAFTQALGSQTMFVGPSYNTNYSGGTVTNLAATGTNTTTTLGIKNNLLWQVGEVTMSTVGLYNWASVVTTPAGTHNILSGDQVTTANGFAQNFYVQIANNGSVASADANYDLLGNATGAKFGVTGSFKSTTFLDTIRFNVAGAFTFNTGPTTSGGSGLVTEVGGILVTPNVGANNTTIANGGTFLSPGNGTGTVGLDVYQNNAAGELLINCPFYNPWNGNNFTTLTGCYVQGGPGTVVLTGQGTSDGQTGATYLNGGNTVINANQQVGGSASTALNLNGGTVVAAANTFLDSGNNGTGTKRAITLLGNGGGLAATNGNTLTIDGVIGSAAGAGPLVIGIPASSANGNTAGLLPGTGSGTANTTPFYGNGTVKLNNTTSNSFYGGVNIVGGATLNINGISALGGTNYLGGFTFTSGTLQYATGTLLGGADISFGGATGTTPQTVSILGSSTIDLNGQTVSYAGSIGNGGSGALTITNSSSVGALYLNGGSTYTGGTTVSTNVILGGSGTIAGNVTVNSGGETFPSAGSGATNTIGGNLTYNSGALAGFNLTTNYTSTNDQIIVTGALSMNGAVHIKAPSTLSSLDTNADYVLLTYGSSSGSFSSLVWDVQPANYNAYSISNDTVHKKILLHYAPSATAPTLIASASPSTLVRNQSTLVSAAVTPGSGTVSSSGSVFLNGSSLGLSSSISLILSAAPNVYTNTITVPAGTAAGSFNLGVWVVDSTPLVGTNNFSLTINVSADTWNGGNYGASANWSNNGNWVSSYAPGLFGDTLVFDGGTGPAPSLDNNYNVTSVTFASSATTPFTIGTANSSYLTLSAGGVTNNSILTQTLNVPMALTAAQTLNAAAGALTLNQNVTNGGNLLTVTDSGFNTAVNGGISGSGGLTKAGPGTLTLGSTNIYTGTTTVNGGALVVNGTGVISNNVSQIIVGNVAGNAILNINGGTVNANDAFNPAVAIGNVANASGFLFMSSGSLECGAGEFHIGQVTNAYGAFDLSGGTVTIGDINAADAYFVVGGAFGATASQGIFNLSGGTFNDNAQELGLGGIAGSIGVLNISGGTLNDSLGIHVGDRGTGILNVSGAAAVNLTGSALQYGSSNAGVAGTVNLLGGTVTANNVAKVGNDTSLLNFNGGTLKAGTNTATFIQGLTAATIYSGGAVIDDGGFAITNGQALLAPAGNGVSTIPVATGGAGYLDTPVVTIARGTGDTTGVGATAVAIVSGGVVTGITITSPGTGYTTAPTVTLFGGGYSSAATLGTPTIAANVSGGLTKQGAGTNTLTGANTYSGNTTINAGTLALSGSGSISNSPTITIATNATLDVSAVVATSYSLNTSGTLALKINKTGATLTQGQLALVTKNLAYGGALTVSATGDALANGDSFTLVTKTTGTLSGWFNSVNLPALASGLSWDTNDLATTGVLDVYTFTTTPLTLNTQTNTPATIAAAKLLNHVTASRAGTLAVTAVSIPVNGGGTVLKGDGSVTYTPAPGQTGSDSFIVTVQDGHGSQTIAASVTLGWGNGQSPNVVFGPTTDGHGNFVVGFAGIPGTTYTVETNSAVNQPGWSKLKNITAPANGVFQITDPIPADLSSRFYRTVYPSY